MALTELPLYLKTKKYRIEIPIPATVFLENGEKISIGKGTVLEPGVSIRGPCIIGENCQIRHGAYIRENTILGNGCSIGHGSEIKGSILLDQAVLAHLGYVGDSIVGNGVNLGAGVKCANLRLDRKEIRIAGKPTGMKKLGAIIGDGAQIGCNCVLNPGTMIGKETLVHPLLHVKGVIAPKMVVRSETSFRIDAQPESVLKELLK